MHIRRNGYVGVAPVPDELTNVCLVRPAAAADIDFHEPDATLRHLVITDPMLRDRFAAATMIAPPVVMGPLAVDAAATPPDGLLLAGDASGFIDPMTGDGLAFAIRGGELAARAAIDAIEHGWTGVQASLAAARARAFAGKWRFNRVLRALVASPRAIAAAAIGARLAPFALRAVITRAGDCDLAL
jgi:flavin-dependent dehydrogenase